MAVKPKYVKDLARLIHERYPDAVSSDFNRNKQIVEQATNVESVEVRNRVAGYLCSLKNRDEIKSQNP